MRKNVSRVNDLRGGGNLGLLGAGNVYRVIATGEAYYDQFMYDHQFEHTDGSAAVHTTIQSALDATVSARNDYVLIQPKEADYDLAAALTLSKKSVHLIGLDSLYGIGAGNACRIHQTGAYPIAIVSDSAIEISGLYLKNYATKGGIILATGCYGSHIHHCYWAMNLSGATNEPMLGPYIADTGTAGGWSTFEDLFFQSQAGNNATIAAVVRVNDDATGVRFQRIQIGIGDNNTATYGIQCDSVKGMVIDCDFFAYPTDSGGDFTHCITIHGSAVAYGNRGNVADGKLVEWGGTTGYGLIQNFNSASGGTQDEED